ncbi:MAG: type 1 glutamine amidotransferase [Nibricoccus sp.]
MNVHVLQHAPFEGLAQIEPLLAARGACLTTTRFFENSALPSLHRHDLVIAMGGPMSVNDEAEYPWLVEEKRFIRATIEKGTPVLGICLGSQLIASALGARVYRNSQKEIGWFPIESVPTPANTFQFPEKLPVFHWHGETFDLPLGAVHLASSKACRHQAFQVGRRTLALQFHLEIDVAAVGAFVGHCEGELTPAPFIQSKEDLLNAPPSYYAGANAWLGRALDYLLG